MSRNVHDLIGDISEMLDTVECEYINVSEDRDYLGRQLKDFKEKEKEFPKAYDLGYEEGFEKGEKSMQEKANKICEYWDKDDTVVLSKLFDGWTWTQIFGDVERAYNKIITYEKEQEEKEFHVGDIVEDIRSVRKLLVTNVVDPYVYTLDKDGRGGVRNQKDVVKTGWHYPLNEFLKGLE